MKISYIATVIVALILALTTISVCLAFSDVIYSGVLADFLPYGAMLSLAGSAILILVVCLFSDIPTAIARPQDEPLPLVIMLAQTIGVYFTSGQAGFLTLFTMMVLTGLITGITLYLFGRFQWGKLARYFPFPVIAGLLSGSGLLLIMSALHQVLPIHEWSWQAFTKLGEFYPLLLWLPSTLYGVLIFILTMRFHHPLILPASIVLGITLFYLVAFIAGASIESLQLHGYLQQINHLSLNHMLEKISLSDPIQWSLLIKYIPIMIAIAFICVLSLLFITISLELIYNKAIDFNKELKIAGIANICSACVGGIVGYHGLGNAVISYKFNVDNRLIGVICAAFCFAAIFFPTIINYFPRFLLIGLVVYLGLYLFYSWTFAIYRRFTELDRYLIFAVITTVVFLGFIQGMMAGLLIAIIFFVYTYSRINVIDYSINGKQLSSSYQRDPTATTILQKDGEKLAYIKLQGFLFFGSANVLVEHIKNLVSNKSSQPINYIVYDISKIKGFDSSSFLSFERIGEYAKDNQLKVILTGLENNKFNIATDTMTDILTKAGISIINNVDDSIKFCEDSILIEAGYNAIKADETKIHLEDYLGNKSFRDQLNDYFEEIHIHKGDYLVKQNELSHDIFYLESGLVAVYLERDTDGRAEIISTIGAGNFIGEIAFYLHSKRSASVIAKNDCVIRKLSQKNLKQMKILHPELAYILQQAIICLLSYKLINTTIKIEILTK